MKSGVNLLSEKKSMFFHYSYLQAFYFTGSLINSKLINFWYSSKFKTPTISGYELHQIPVKKLNISDPAEKTQHDRLVSLVDSMLEAQKQHHVSTIDADKKLYKQKIDILDKQIDSLVYQLYKLTDEEIEKKVGE